MVSVLIYLEFFFKSVFNPVIEDHYYFDKPHSIRIRSYYRFWLHPWYVQSFLKLLKCSFYTYTSGNCHIKRIQHRHFLFKCLCQATKEDRSCIFVKVSILSLSKIFTIGLWNCSDSVALFVFICDFGTVSTMWHYLFWYWTLEPFWKCDIIYLYMGLSNCSESVALFVFICDIGTVPIVWHYLFFN